MSWAQERRLDFIDDMLVTKGEVRRKDVCLYFDVSTPQASTDFAAFLRLDPNFKRDTRRRCYVRDTGDSVRDSTPERRAAWAIFADTTCDSPSS